MRTWRVFSRSHPEHEILHRQTLAPFRVARVRALRKDFALRGWVISTSQIQGPPGV